MPVYAYGCKDCGHAFDIRQSFTDDALTECPECHGLLRKKFNTVGVVFKGSGFYRNDSRASSSGSSSGESGAGKDTAAGSSENSGGSGSSGGSDKSSPSATAGTASASSSGSGSS